MNYDELFKPYTKDGHTLENSLKFLTTIAAKKGISNEVVQLAVNDIFLQIQNGKEFSKEKCSCGCGIDKAATDLIHSIQRRMNEIDEELTVEVKKLMNEKWNLLVEARLKQISNFDKEYAKMTRPKKNGLNKLSTFFGLFGMIVTPNFMPPPN